MAIYTIYKNIGETPLQALERLRTNELLPQDEKMTYAGRLDPMAEGLLVILSGSDILKKKEILSLDKEYEFTVVFGVSTDTADTLGLITKFVLLQDDFFKKNNPHMLEKNFTGSFNWEYPLFSSKTVKGKPLFSYAREDSLVTIPKRVMNIKKLSYVDVKKYSIVDFVNSIISRVQMVGGDFRQEEIIKQWRDLQNDNKNHSLFCITFNARVGSGTYIRTLAEKMGESFSVPACAFSIKRISVGGFSI